MPHLTIDADFANILKATQKTPGLGGWREQESSTVFREYQHRIVANTIPQLASVAHYYAPCLCRKYRRRMAASVGRLAHSRPVVRLYGVHCGWM